MVFKQRYKQGYACAECFKQGTKDRQVPVYFRIDGKFVFANRVNCRFHGITESVKLTGVYVEGIGVV